MAFLEPPSQNVLREARSGRLEQQVQLSHRNPHCGGHCCRREIRLRQMPSGVVLGLSQLHCANRTALVAGRPAACQREKTAEIVDDTRQFGVVEFVHRIIEGVKICPDQPVDAM
jgi:hypothetical protein